jgi:uncharacterized repeat protein (TIGR01451 family)
LVLKLAKIGGYVKMKEKSALILFFFLLLLPLTKDNNEARAQPSGSSSGFGVFVDLNLIPLIGGGINISLGPVPTVSGTAPPDYNLTSSAVSASVSSPLTGNILSTGVLVTNANSNISGDTVSADSTVNNIALYIVELLQLLTLSADSIQSTAEISGQCGSSLTATGTTTVTNAQANGTLGAGLTIPLNPAPNTVLLNALGIRVVLNEQITGGDGVNSLSITVNAVHITIENSVLSAIGALSGDIIISQSRAQLQCQDIGEESSDVSITKSDTPDPVTVGNQLTYILTISNNGPDTATNVVVTDTLPSSFEFVSATPSSGGICATPGVGELGGTVSCTFPSLSPNSTATVTIVVIPTQTETVINTATVISDTTDPDESNNTDSESTEVQEEGGSPVADLSITKTDNKDPIRAGEQLTYTITVTNIGPDTATNTVVTDMLPDSVEFISAIPSQGNCMKSGSNPGGTVTCNLNNLASGATATITIAVKPTEPGTIENLAIVGGDESDPNNQNNSDTESTEVNSSVPVIAVPTLSEWGIIIMTALLGFYTTLVLRKRMA